MSRERGGGAPRRGGGAHPEKKQGVDPMAESHISLDTASALARGEDVAEGVRAHLASCRPCRERLTRAERLLQWQELVLRAPVEHDDSAQAPAHDSDVGTVSATEAYRYYLASRKTLDEMPPFRLQLDVKAGRLTRVDRRRVEGPRGKVEGGVRLPLGPHHAVDVLVTGSPPGLEVVVAEIEGERPIRFLHGVDVGMREGKRWKTTGTDRTGRVRLDLNLQRRRKPVHLEIAHIGSKGPLLCKLDIEMVRT